MKPGPLRQVLWWQLWPIVYPGAGYPTPVFSLQHTVSMPYQTHSGSERSSGSLWWGRIGGGPPHWSACVHNVESTKHTTVSRRAAFLGSLPATPSHFCVVIAGPGKPAAVDWQVVSVFATKPSVLNLNIKATHICVD